MGGIDDLSHANTISHQERFFAYLLIYLKIIFDLGIER